MKIKKHTLFLRISLAIFLFTAIISIIYLCKTESEINRTLETDHSTSSMVSLGLSSFFNWLGVAGFLGTELSFIRSVYKILKDKPSGWIKVCYIISASLAFLILALCCFIIIDIFDFASPSVRVYIGYIVLFGFPPASILSFILGSLPTGKFSAIDEDYSNFYKKTSK